MNNDLNIALWRVFRADASENLAEIEGLLSRGADPNTRDANGLPILVAAAIAKSVPLAELLLRHGADPDIGLKTDTYEIARKGIKGRDLPPRGMTEEEFWRQKKDRAVPVTLTAAHECVGGEMARLLLKAGADLRPLHSPRLLDALETKLIPASTVDPADLPALSLHRYGNANPERADNPWWREIIRRDWGGIDRDTLLEFAYGERQYPSWSFDRYGHSVTRLPDGRHAVIGGAVEDWYDPNFCIYNEVLVFDRKGGFEHYIYPRDVFPPTDMHSATVVGDALILIGNLGCKDERPEGATQVLRLSLADFSVEQIETTGDNPGWIHGHLAVLQGDDVVIGGGTVYPGPVENTGTFALNLGTWRWRQLG